MGLATLAKQARSYKSFWSKCLQRQCEVVSSSNCSKISEGETRCANLFKILTGKMIYLLSQQGQAEFSLKQQQRNSDSSGQLLCLS